MLIFRGFYGDFGDFMVILLDLMVISWNLIVIFRGFNGEFR